MKMNWVVLGFCILFGILRFIVPVEGTINNADIYKDLAHLFVGGLFGAAIAQTSIYHNYVISWLQSFWANKWSWFMAFGMTILEVVAFIIRKKA